jgi:hypothetical protein
MTKTRPSRPIPNDVALIDRSDLPEGSVLAASDNPVATRIEWEQKAIPLIEQYALRPGVDGFQIAEAATAMDIDTPPDPAHDWGRLATRMRMEGSLEAAGVAEAKRRTCNRSLLRLWRATEALRAKRGAV